MRPAGQSSTCLPPGPQLLTALSGGGHNNNSFIRSARHSRRSSG